MTEVDVDNELARLDLAELLDRSTAARARARALLQRLQTAQPTSEHDLSAQLTLARSDLHTIADGIRHAWALNLGYGPDTQTYEPRITSTWSEGSPSLSTGERHRIDVGYHDALQLIAAAHHDYGDLPDGQTVWPIEPLEGRTVRLEEALTGAASLDIALAELQRCRHELSAQEISIALDVAETTRKALNALPSELWEGRPATMCPGVPTYACGREVRDGRTRCVACRQRFSRMQRKEAS